MKNIMIFKRKKGEVTDFALILMFFFVISVIWQVFLFTQRSINIKDDIDATINQYLLCVEADGYLSDGNRTALSGDLSRLGMTELDFTGTDDPLNPKVYGERVTLHIRGKLEIPIFEVSWLKLKRTTTQVNIDEKRVSVSHGIS